MLLKIRGSHLTCKVTNKCLNVCECREMAERNKNGLLPSPAVPWIVGPCEIKLCDKSLNFSCYATASPEGRTDWLLEAMLTRTNWIADQISDRTFFWKKWGHKKFMWLLKRFGPTVPLWISKLGKHMFISLP